jgi:cellulose synthase/poly-beta-1,6-N-acetylglucosamine synthase-like glycosyltransferase
MYVCTCCILYTYHLKHAQESLRRVAWTPHGDLMYINTYIHIYSYTYQLKHPEESRSKLPKCHTQISVCDDQVTHFLFGKAQELALRQRNGCAQAPVCVCVYMVYTRCKDNVWMYVCMHPCLHESLRTELRWAYICMHVCITSYLPFSVRPNMAILLNMEPTYIYIYIYIYMICMQLYMFVCITCYLPFSVSPSMAISPTMRWGLYACMYASIYVCMYHMLPSILRKPQQGDLPEHEASAGDCNPFAPVRNKHITCI